MASERPSPFCRKLPLGRAQKDAGRTAEMLGYPNPRMLYKHFRALVKPKGAAGWWAVVPGQADEKTVAIA